MQVILLEDLKNKGRAGDVVKVNDGYARNMLIPKGIAMEATPANMKLLEKKREKIEAQRAMDLERAQEIKEKIEAGMVTVKAKAGESGRLFGAVTSQDIAEAIKETFGFELDKKKVELPAPIKEIGISSVDIKLFSGVVAKCKVQVEVQQ